MVEPLFPGTLGWVLIVAVVVLVGLGVVVSGIDSRPGPLRLARIPGARLSLAIGVFAIVAVVLGVIWSPVLQATHSPPTRAFGPVTGQGPAFMGIDDYGQAHFSQRSNALVEYSFYLGNFGDGSVTVTGLQSPAFFEEEQVGSGLVPASEASAVAAEPTLRNVQFSIPPGGRVRVTLLARIISCPGLDSVETLAPGISPSASMANDLETRSNIRYSPMPMQLGYLSADGSSHVVSLEWPANMVVEGGDPSGCQATSWTPAPPS